MEQVLLKIARQLDSIDEASLLALWEDYAQRVTKFEPTKRWEEAVLVLGLIQAKHWKNQLFNQQYSAHVRPDFQGNPADRPFGFSLEKDKPKHQAAILQFKPRQSGQSGQSGQSEQAGGASAQDAEPCSSESGHVPGQPGTEHNPI